MAPVIAGVLQPEAQARIVLTRGGAEIASWPLEPSGRVGLELVDALARLRLVAQRLGCSIQVRDAWPALTDLLDLVGLHELRCSSVLEPGGEPEGGEQLRVQEVVQTRDPAV